VLVRIIGVKNMLGIDKMVFVDPYKLLGVTFSNDREKVREKFKQLALLCHPDKGGSKDDMETLYGAYRYVLQQIEFGEHGRTMEDEELQFKEFMEEQVKEPIPSIFEIMTDEANRKFNEAWMENEGEKLGMCYENHYGDKMDAEPDVFTRQIIEYKEPKTVEELTFGRCLDLKVKNVKDFSGKNGADYVLAHSHPEEIKPIQENNVLEEFEKIKKLRNEDVLCAAVKNKIELDQ